MADLYITDQSEIIKPVCVTDFKQQPIHAKSPSFQTETTETTETTPEPSPQFNFGSFEFQSPFHLSSSFFPERFTSQVPEHFICLLCKNVVQDPQECESCESLLCFLCISNNSNCPCSHSKFKRPSKFALKIYETLHLTCINQSFGCNFIGSIPNMQHHEQVCSFQVVQCDNSLCDQLIIKNCENNNESHEVPLLCSEICENTIKFSIILDETDKFSTIENFKAFNERCKRLVELEVNEKMNDMIKKVEEFRRKNEVCRKLKDRMRKEILARTSFCHPGKWNVKSLKWTCCNINEIASIGCKQIA